MTVTLELERFAYLEKCTIGRIRHPGLSVPIVTLERPWIRNENGPGGCLSISCVPDGTYELAPHDGARFQDVYSLRNPSLGVFYQTAPPECGPANARLWGRTAILMHRAAQVTDVIGCIGLGQRFVTYSDTVTLLRSLEALTELRALLGQTERHVLIIRPTRGTA